MHLYTTLIIAFLSALIATVIGTAGSHWHAGSMENVSKDLYDGRHQHSHAERRHRNRYLPDAVCLSPSGFPWDLPPILLAHITFNIPYVILSVMPKLKQTRQTHLRSSTWILALLRSMPFSRWSFRISCRVYFPDFLLAFTMSLDDFVITHFTKGAGSRHSYPPRSMEKSEKESSRKSTRLSTLLFLTVLLLLILLNTAPDKKDPKTSKAKPLSKGRKASNFVFRRVVPAMIALTVLFGGIYYGTKNGVAGDNQVIVYNFGRNI